MTKWIELPKCPKCNNTMNCLYDNVDKKCFCRFCYDKETVKCQFGNDIIQWIKCSEKMPEIDEIVLIYPVGETIVRGFRNAKNDCWYDCDWNSCNPTHWMPLPTCPKKED